MKKLLKLEDEAAAAAAAQMVLSGKRLPPPTHLLAAESTGICWHRREECKNTRFCKSSSNEKCSDADAGMTQFSSWISPELDGMTWHGYYYYTSSSHYTRGLAATNDYFTRLEYDECIVVLGFSNNMMMMMDDDMLQKKFVAYGGMKRWLNQ